jgi:hypothetical protein
MEKTPTFLLLFTNDGVADSLFNLDQIRVIDQITETSLRLFFTETHAVTINGAGAVQELLGLIAKNAITADGRTLPEIIAVAQQRSEPQAPSSVSPEGRELGAMLQHLVLHKEPPSD